MKTARPRILVTGAAGFVGTRLCGRLIEAGYQLVTLTRSARPPASVLPAGTPDFQGDIRDRAVLDRAMAGIDTVFHLAGVAHVDSPDPATMQAVSVDGTRAVAAAAAAAGVRKVVYFSSSLAQAAEQGSPYATAYGQARYQAELSLLAAAGPGKFTPVILRPVNVYGPGMQGNIATLIRLIRRHLLPPLPRLTTRYSLVGLEDLCQVAQLAMEKTSVDGGTWTVTDGQIYLLNELEAAIYRALDRQPPAWHCPRMVFLAAALAAGLANRMPGVNGSFGLRTYRNLLRDSLFDNRPLCQALDFRPRETFYTALPGLTGS